MFDLHTHILPGIDDGSRNAQMSIDMLREEIRGGAQGIALTPHFYADMMDLPTFLERRQSSFDMLNRAVELAGIEVPQLIPGAEVHYFRGIGRSSSLKELTIGNSNCLLLELPFGTWPGNILEEIGNIVEIQGLTVIIAHVERYLDRDRIKDIIDNEDLIKQSNAEFFTDRRAGRKALKMLREGKIQLLGSDCHNMKYRRPNLDEAIRIIEKKLGREYIDDINERSEGIFREAGA